MRKLCSVFCLAFISTMISQAAAADDTAGFYEKFPSLSQSRWAVSNGWSNGDYDSCEWRQDAIMATPGDVRLTLSDRGGKTRPLGCPEMHTNARLGYGLYETKMRSGAGSGLDTGFFTYIGPPQHVPEWDEIDFEFLGKNPRTVQINYYVNGKGGHEVIVPFDFDASQSFHIYAFDWEPTKIRWYVDGKMVHETADGTMPLPHNPGLLFFNMWSGTPSNVAWLGLFNYQSPITADVQWVAYTPTDKPCQFPESIKCKQNQ